VQRQSDKHSGRIDDELERETASLTRGAPVEARAQESREKEGAAEGEPTPDAPAPTSSPAGAEAVLAGDAVNARTELARHLEGAVFPADREALVRSAEGQQAPNEILRQLRTLPGGTPYANVQEVWRALGGQVEGSHT
jgi:hypothetical protein